MSQHGGLLISVNWRSVKQYTSIYIISSRYTDATDQRHAIFCLTILDGHKISRIWRHLAGWGLNTLILWVFWSCSRTRHWAGLRQHPNCKWLISLDFCCRWSALPPLPHPNTYPKRDVWCDHGMCVFAKQSKSTQRCVRLTNVCFKAAQGNPLRSPVLIPLVCFSQCSHQNVRQLLCSLLVTAHLGAFGSSGVGFVTSCPIISTHHVPSFPMISSDFWTFLFCFCGLKVNLLDLNNLFLIKVLHYGPQELGHFVAWLTNMQTFGRCLMIGFFQHRNKSIVWTATSWWFQILIFSPLPGEMIQFD